MIKIDQRTTCKSGLKPHDIAIKLNTWSLLDIYKKYNETKKINQWFTKIFIINMDIVTAYY